MKRIITIGRELGSGGRTIGKLVANRLGIAYYDHELIDEAAKKTGLAPQYIESAEQKVTNSFLYSLAIGSSYGYGVLQSANQQTLPLSEQVFEAQKEVVKDIAKKEKCVIVGRCADYILSDRDDVLNVFIYADKNSRVEHAVREYGMERSSALKKLEKSDKERGRHYNTYTDKVWGDRHNYDLMLDSSRIDYENCAKLICTLAKEL